jgi:oligopeptide transport system substrate-binding protein
MSRDPMEHLDPEVREWWNDPVQKARFEERMSHSSLGRRKVLGIMGAFAAGTALIACGSDDKDEAPSGGTTGGTTGGTSAGQQAGTGSEKLAKTQLYRNTVTDEPATFDYAFNLYAMASAYPLAAVLQYDENNNIKPDMAESFSVNATGDVYTFKIRRNTKWSNGDPVTAQDFIWSWTRRLDPNSGADYAAFLYDIKNGKKFNNKEITDPSVLGLKAIDDYTLEVTTEGPAGYFPALAAYAAAMPANRKGAEQHGKTYGQDADKFVSNGPFKLTKWEHNKSFELTKHENYWNKDNIKLERMTYLIVKQDQRVPTYENNEIDNVPSGNVGDLKRIMADPKLSKEVFRFDQVGSWYLMPNPKFKPFDNPKVRLAMAHAIDRDKLVKDVLQGLGTPAFTQMNPGSPFYNSNKYDEFTRFDPRVAMDQLKGTEYEGGKNWPKITMSMRSNEADAHKASMAAIVQMYKEHLGMNIDSEVGDPQAVYREMRQGNKQLMWIRWYMDYPDPNNAHGDCFYSKIPAGSRRSWWENAEFDSLVEQGQREPDLAKRQAIYKKADEILVREAGAIFAYYPLAYGLRKPTIKGQPVSKEGLPVPDWNIYIREAEKLYVVEA